MATDVDEFLAHYGVPGMKWGKRKANPDKYQKKADKKLRDAKKNYETIKNEQGRFSKNSRAAAKDLIDAKALARSAPSKTWAVMGGLSNKNRYSDPTAIKQRASAGKLAAAGAVAGIASMGAREVLNQTARSGGRAAVGALVATTILSTAGAGLGVASIVQATKAASNEQKSRA